MKIVTPLNLVLLAAMVAITLAGLLLVPESRLLPVHWGLNGQADRVLPRNLALLQMPVLTAVVWAIFFAIHRWGNPTRRAGAATVLRLALPGLTALIAAIQLLIVLLGAGVALPFVQAH